MASSTPREAKQELLDDIVNILRTSEIKYKETATAKEVFAICKHENRRLITEIADHHGLTIKQ